MVETSELANEPYSIILGYPRCSKDELNDRAKELIDNGVEALLFDGKDRIGNLNLLGKGCVSLVVKGIHEGKEVAVKIRRTDADRATMDREGEFLKLANRVGVGPRFIRSSKNFLLLELIQGLNIFRFIDGEDDKEKVASIAREVLEQCHKLDSIGLDHGELSDMREHVIIGDSKVTIIDFESASVDRRVSNVTAATQYLFIGGILAKKVRELLTIQSIDPILSSLRGYKNNISKENFERLMQTLHL